MSGRRVIVVTGGSGFVGGHVVRALVAAGHDVRSVGRRPGRHDGDRFVYADLRSAGTHAGLPHAGLPHADLPHFGDAAVVHCAAATRDGLDPEVFDTNLALTRGALALADGPFVHLSSSSVYNLAKPSVNAGVAAADGAYPWLNSYGESKYSSEGIVADAGRGTAIILRPHAVYGAGDTTLLPRLRRAIRLGVLPLPGGVGSSRVDLQACKLEYSIVSPK